MPKGGQMKINKAWHEAHKLPRNATLEQRLEWHLSHAFNCGCREMPAKKIREELKARGLLDPTLPSLK
jgi:hypothetical protein